VGHLMIPHCKRSRTGRGGIGDPGGLGGIGGGSGSSGGRWPGSGGGLRIGGMPLRGASRGSDASPNS